MGKGFNTIAFHQDRCDGCDNAPVCMSACAKVKSKDNNLLESRIRIVPGENGLYELAMCRQCGDAKCVMNCPAGALIKNGENGVIDWNSDKCVNCLLCTVGCAFGGITYESSIGHVIKCDSCDGDPACVKACPTGALEYNISGKLYNKYGDKEDLFAPGLAACQGCHSELLIRHVLRMLGRNTVVAAPPGCIPGMGTVGYNGKTGTKVPVFHPLLTNTAAMLTGLKRHYDREGRTDITALALAGDGGASDVGFQSLSGAAERNEKILFACVDNEGYMNTGMQASGCTSYGSWTSTTPVGENLKGKGREPKNMPVVMMMHNCSYVATASLAFMPDLYEKLEKAREATKHGMAYLHIYAPCPSGWRFASGLTTEVCRRQVESNFVTLWEFEPGKGLTFTHPIDKPMAMEEYLEVIGKYKHLDQAQIDHIKRSAVERLRFLMRFAA